MDRDRSGSIIRRGPAFTSVEEVFASYIGFSYFQAFTRGEHNDENLLFFTSVRMFIRDNTVAKWDRKERLHRIRSIYDEHCHPGAPKEICLDSVAARVLVANMEKGYDKTDIFDAAMKCAVRTLRLDIWPRFVRSQKYREFIQRMRVEYTALEIPAPNDIEFISSNMSSRVPSLQDALRCRALYESFLAYCSAKHCQENLVFCQAVRLFVDAVKDQRVADSKEIAWLIYHEFVKTTAHNRVSLMPSSRRCVESNLASPSADMFDDSKMEVLRVLQSEFGDYLSSVHFERYIAESSNIMRRIRHRFSVVSDVLPRMFQIPA